MEQDISQLRLLSIFNYIFAGLWILGGLLFGGMYIVSGMFAANAQTTEDSTISAATLGGIFTVVGIVVAVIFIIIGILCWMAGNSLRKHKGYGFSFVIAILHLFNFPLGTALGIFSLVVLNRPTVKALFKGEALPTIGGTAPAV
ncbi:MAG: hypothetical protein JO308_02380 [Verrucomicrobia bacterium]|nr:hypothetical protein [Verrucomicrobiota bacterium]